MGSGIRKRGGMGGQGLGNLRAGRKREGRSSPRVWGAPAKGGLV